MLTNVRLAATNNLVKGWLEDAGHLVRVCANCQGAGKAQGILVRIRARACAKQAPGGWASMPSNGAVHHRRRNHSCAGVLASR